MNYTKLTNQTPKENVYYSLRLKKYETINQFFSFTSVHDFKLTSDGDTEGRSELAFHQNENNRQIRKQ